MTPKKILLIEDSEAIASVVTLLLAEAGYRITSISHQRANTLTGFESDLIILDEWLNEQEGHMLCQEIKDVRDLQHTPMIIFSTAVDIEELKERCGADGLVRKPFDIDDLIKEVRRCCP